MLKFKKKKRPDNKKRILDIYIIIPFIVIFQPEIYEIFHTQTPVSHHHKPLQGLLHSEFSVSPPCALENFQNQIQQLMHRLCCVITGDFLCRDILHDQEKELSWMIRQFCFSFQITLAL